MKRASRHGSGLSMEIPRHGLMSRYWSTVGLSLLHELSSSSELLSLLYIKLEVRVGLCFGLTWEFSILV